MVNTKTSTAEFGPLGGVVLGALAENWWLLLLRGVAATAFGALAFVWPGLTLLSLTILWGAYTISDGALALWAGISVGGRDGTSRWWLALSGVVGILAGVVAFIWPGLTALALLTFIAVWAIVIGAMQIWGAIQMRKEIDGEWLLGLNGLLSIAFGVFMIFQPAAGALSVAWIIGWYAALAGFISIGLAFRVKKYKQA